MTRDADWVYDSAENREKNPYTEVREYRQILSKILNTLIGLNLQLIYVSDTEHFYPNLEEEPGSWDHYVAYAPYWLSFWCQKA